MAETIPRAEGEIKTAMINACAFVQALHERLPDLPDSAISVGLINYGCRIGCAAVGAETVAKYLRDIANIVEARVGVDVPGGFQ